MIDGGLETQPALQVRRIDSCFRCSELPLRACVVGAYFAIGKG